jgi:hypothetical protein
MNNEERKLFLVKMVIILFKLLELSDTTSCTNGSFGI